MVRLFLLWSTLGAALAASIGDDQQFIQYHVVANPQADGKLGVTVDQDIYPLEADPNVPLLYSGRAPGGKEYRYVTLGAADEILDTETFDRPAMYEAKDTYNEVYGRPWNKIFLPELPQLYDFDSRNKAPLIGSSNQTVKDPAKNDLFEDGTIATIHITADEEDIQAMHANKMDKKAARMDGKLTFISYKDIRQIDNVEIKVGGHSSREWAKVPYKINIPDTDENGLYRRWELKLRSESTDPTMMREKIYNDLLKATGVQAARGVYVRLYFNDTPVGLYYLVDDPGAATYVQETMKPENGTSAEGTLIQGDAGKGLYAANFAFRGENEADYDDKVYKVEVDTTQPGEPSAMERLIQFNKFIADYDPDAYPNASDPSALAVWEKEIDIFRYLKQLAVEWIGGNWDAVQYSGNNFALYYHPAMQRYVMLPMDFDYTFGNGLEEDQRGLLTGHWRDFTQNRKVHSFIFEKLKRTPSMVALYESIQKQINDHVSNPDVLLPRVDGLTYMLQRDIVWDQSLERFTVGAQRVWSADNYLQVLEEGSGEADERIGLKEWIRGKYEAIKDMDNIEPVPVDEELMREEEMEALEQQGQAGLLQDDD
ncbi:coth protein-domain-containing protein [Syncephalastrum racemosum]|uniref:Coth protein-domain-containing protein n=1 Tax=Syncephalastrum racemosum TaxID=13706 RepID=A0A1X2H6W2_SYNRA|nr:coth protein-domain-containing protein [Syncephalastrum racemosum]